MRNSLTRFTCSSFLVSALFLTAACSVLDEESTGSGLSNTTNNDFDISTLDSATISDANKDDLATAATESIKQAVNNIESSFFAGAKVASSDPIQLVTVATAQQISQSPAQVEVPNVCDSGTININNDTRVVTVKNCVTNGVTLNGTASITTSENGDVITTTYAFTNFEIADGTDTITVNLVTVCENKKAPTDINPDARTTTCSYRSESTFNNRTYRSLTSDISGNGTIGYTVTATINDPDYGNIDVTTITVVTFNCPAGNNQPDSGEIEVTGETSTSTLNVLFNGCNEAIITFNGTPSTLTWP